MNATAKADQYLAAGRVIVTTVEPGSVKATVRGDGHSGHVDYADPAGWFCTCPARSRCCHLIAVRKVVAIDL